MADTIPTLEVDGATRAPPARRSPRESPELDPQRTLRMVGLIYRAVGDPTLWPGFLSELDDALGVSGVAHSKGRGPPDVLEFWGRIEDPLRPLPGQRNTPADPGRNGRAALVRIGPDGPDERMAMPTAVVETDLPGTRRRAAVAQCLDARGSLLKTLMPHLQRAWRLSQRIAGLEEQCDAAAAAIRKLRIGVILLDSTGRVLLVNPAARQILRQRDGLSLRRKTLTAALDREAANLRELIRGAASGPRQGHEAGGPMMVSRPSGRASLSVLVVPMRTPGRTSPHPGRSAMIFLSDSESRVLPSPQVLQRLYGLTPAESAFCARLVGGRTVAQIAVELRVSANTARTHLKRILAKTGTGRQSELVRLLLSGPAGLHPESVDTRLSPPRS